MLTKNVKNDQTHVDIFQEHCIHNMTKKSFTRCDVCKPIMVCAKSTETRYRVMNLARAVS